MVTDDLPAGVEYVAGSLHLEFNGNKDLSDAQDGDEGFVQGQHVEIRVPLRWPRTRWCDSSFKAQLGQEAPELWD